MIASLRPSAATMVLTFLALLAIAACGESAPQSVNGTPLPTRQECSGPGSADTAAFDQFFTSMEFGSGSPPIGENGQRFGKTDAVVVETDAKSEVVTRFCLQERGRSGTVKSNNSATLVAGVNRTDLGAIDSGGTYVIRVWVGDKLVRNLPFTVE
ncbi:MAG: hypothetical protein FJ319_02000 [SAR202 cluster bacterium]|nr:hypothetical protein [SAR202 cluster bacterium]